MSKQTNIKRVVAKFKPSSCDFRFLTSTFTRLSKRTGAIDVGEGEGEWQEGDEGKDEEGEADEEEDEEEEEKNEEEEEEENEEDNEEEEEGKEEDLWTLNDEPDFTLIRFELFPSTFKSPSSLSPSPSSRAPAPAPTILRCLFRHLGSFPVRIRVRSELERRSDEAVGAGGGGSWGGGEVDEVRRVGVGVGVGRGTAKIGSDTGIWGVEWVAL